MLGLRATLGNPVPCPRARTVKLSRAITVRLLSSAGRHATRVRRLKKQTIRLMAYILFVKEGQFGFVDRGGRGVCGKV